MMLNLPKPGRLLARTAARLGFPSAVASPYARWRVPLHAPEFPLVLLFSPKAGCTSLTKWFLFQIGKLEEASRYHAWIHAYRTSVLTEQPGYRAEAARLVEAGAKPVVKLVRNPYDRALSSFLHVLNVAPKRDAESWERKLISSARSQAGKPEATVALSFRDFLRILPAIGTGLDEINSHIARQHVPGENGRISRIIKLERFAEEIRSLEAEFALARSPLETITESRHHRSRNSAPPVAEGACAADVEITPKMVRSRRVPAYESFYDEETRGLVRTCFAIDFEAYGYEP